MPDCDYYVKNRFGRYDDISEDEESIRKKLAKAEVLKITGIAKLKENSENMLMTSPIGYTKLLTDYIIEYTDNSSVVKAQRADENVNAITGMAFEPKDDSEKAKGIHGTDGTACKNCRNISAVRKFKKRFFQFHSAYQNETGTVCHDFKCRQYFKDI